MRLPRNVSLVRGRYRVLITRRPASIFGGYHPTVAEAIAARDRLEATLPPPKPRGYAKGARGPVKTMTQVRADRVAAGLCMYCGDVPPRPARKGCADCLVVMATKMTHRRATLTIVISDNSHGPARPPRPLA